MKVALLQSLQDDVTVFYDYTVKDGETPEDIAYKYYGDPGLHWLVILANQIQDPQFDWPLSYDSFVSYMNTKYAYLNTTGSNIAGVNLAMENTQSYQLIVSSTDSITGDTTVNTYVIDENTYNITPAETFQEVNLPDGSLCTLITTTNELSFYDYEVALNDAKANIRLIDKTYLDQILAEFATLVAS